VVDIQERIKNITNLQYLQFHTFPKYLLIHALLKEMRICAFAKEMERNVNLRFLERYAHLLKVTILHEL
jgi:hypothetical protein